MSWHFVLLHLLSLNCLLFMDEIVTCLVFRKVSILDRFSVYDGFIKDLCRGQKPSFDQIHPLKRGILEAAVL